MSTSHRTTGRAGRTARRAATVALAAAASYVALPHAAAHAAGGQTYYLSPSGSDSNVGTDPAHPFQSLAKVSNGFLNAGDTVLLQKGATFNGKLALWHDGTATNRITVSSYGAGAKPVVTGQCLEVGASYITISNIEISNCNLNGIWTAGDHNVITHVEADHNVQGIDVDYQADGTQVVNNYLHDNDKMAPNTPGAFDDWGAVGMVVSGDNTQVSYNRIINNWAPSADFGTDGSAVEIYGGIGTVVDHNVAINNRTFTELGNSRSANTVFAYNVVRSSLDYSEVVITRGDQDYFGPVVNTLVENNTVKMTGAHSRGFVCDGNCTGNDLQLVANIFDVAGIVGQVQGTFTGSDNIYWHGQMMTPMLPGDRFVNPAFTAGSLVPSASSPAIDQAKTVMKLDVVNHTVGVDGNGDGKGGADIGAYEAGSHSGGKANTHGGQAHHHHSQHHHHKHGHKHHRGHRHHRHHHKHHGHRHHKGRH